MGRSERGGAQIGTPVRGKEASTRAARGRVCEAAGCATILSTYNKTAVCSVHSEPAYRHALYRA